MNFDSIQRYPSTIALIAANLVPLAGIYWFGWDTISILLLYWTESAVVGVFTILKMLRANAPSGAKLGTVGFFTVHYGLFMIGHLAFLLAFAATGIFKTTIRSPTLEGFFPIAIIADAFTTIFYGSIALFASHAFSFATNYIGKREYENTKLKDIMWAPYKRVVLMHLVIIFGAMFSIPAILLIVGKTGIDLHAHLAERRNFEKR